MIYKKIRNLDPVYHVLYCIFIVFLYFLYIVFSCPGSTQDLHTLPGDIFFLTVTLYIRVFFRVFFCVFSVHSSTFF